MNTESDYLHDSSIAFSTKKLGKCALLELGQYGPAREKVRSVVGRYAAPLFTG
jgi:hypothetical protein